MTTDDRTVTNVNSGGPRLPVESTQLKAGDILEERFLLRTILGAGASGTVFSAVDMAVGQKVAIKLLHPELRDVRTRERLRREVRASRSGHPNIVSVFDLHESGDHLFLSMELVKGKSLRSIMEGGGPFSITQVISVGRQIVAALANLHDQGLVHRDVKPGNILVASDGTVKLCDMGLVRSVKEGMTVTETEMVVGTPDYMAPEQATGAELTGSSDMYGLGLSLYRALTGEIPLRESTAVATLSRRQRERVPSLRRRRPDCPRWLDRLIRRMLEPKPRDRITPSAALDALEDRRLRPKIRRGPAVAIVLALMTTTLGAAAVGWLAHRPTAVVAVGGSHIEGFDEQGRTTWHRELAHPVFSEQREDLDGDGISEVILILSPERQTSTPVSEPVGPEVWIFSLEGRVLTRFFPQREVRWSFDYTVDILATSHLVDVDHDGRPEVVVVGRHVNFFPAVVFLYRPALDTWDQVVTHPGHILNIRATPPQSAPGLRFVAVNNRLGVMGFLGEILIEEAADETFLDIKDKSLLPGLRSPPFASNAAAGSFRWSAYVPLPLESRNVMASDTDIKDLAGGGLELTSGDGDVVTFDWFWNNTRSPNAGVDLRPQRWKFMADLMLFSPKLQMMAPRDVAARRDEMLAGFESVLDEPVYRLLLDLKSARAIARTGEVERARDILTTTVADTGEADAEYRLAHFEALAGDAEHATERLVRLITDPRESVFATRSMFDGPHLAIRTGIETFDQEAVETAIMQLSAKGMSEEKVRVAEALRARARLWWDQLQPEDLDVKSWSYAPAGDAVACLARWRKGVGKPEDADAMADFAQRYPDASVEGRLAGAAAAIGNGRSRQALDDLNLLTQQLSFPARDDFALRQLLDLAQALRIVALQADGQVGRAQVEAQNLRPSLTDALLPAILVDEIIANDRKPGKDGRSGLA